MFIPIMFLHIRAGELAIGVDYLMFDNLEEFQKTSETTLAAIVKDLGYDVVQILTLAEDCKYVQL